MKWVRDFIVIVSLAVTGAMASEPQGIAQSPLPGKDAYDVQTLRRDPFWPVGWTPPVASPIAPTASQPQATLTRWDEARKLLKITGLSQGKDGKFLAIMKDIGVVEEGDTVSVKHMGLTYKWRIKEITRSGILPERVGAYTIKQ